MAVQPGGSTVDRRHHHPASRRAHRGRCAGPHCRRQGRVAADDRAGDFAAASAAAARFTTTSDPQGRCDGRSRSRSRSPSRSRPGGAAQRGRPAPPVAAAVHSAQDAIHRGQHRGFLRTGAAAHADPHHAAGRGIAVPVRRTGGGCRRHCCGCGGACARANALPDSGQAIWRAAGARFPTTPGSTAASDNSSTSAANSSVVAVRFPPCTSNQPAPMAGRPMER